MKSFQRISFFLLDLSWRVFNIYCSMFIGSHVAHTMYTRFHHFKLYDIYNNKNKLVFGVICWQDLQNRWTIVSIVASDIPFYHYSHIIIFGSRRFKTFREKNHSQTEPSRSNNSWKLKKKHSRKRTWNELKLEVLFVATNLHPYETMR